MVFTSTEKLPNKENNKKYIFLAGSIDSNVSDNWRSQVITSNYNQNHFFDPTHKNYEYLNPVDMKAHIQWELDALAMSDKIILQFLPDALSPISLVELGLYVSSEKLIVRAEYWAEDSEIGGIGIEEVSYLNCECPDNLKKYYNGELFITCGGKMLETKSDDYKKINFDKVWDDAEISNSGVICEKFDDYIKNI